MQQGVGSTGLTCSVITRVDSGWTLYPAGHHTQCGFLLHFTLWATALSVDSGCTLPCGPPHCGFSIYLNNVGVAILGSPRKLPDNEPELPGRWLLVLESVPVLELLQSNGFIAT